jgi:hypothetical protein
MQPGINKINCKNAKPSLKHLVQTNDRFTGFFACKQPICGYLGHANDRFTRFFANKSHFFATLKESNNIDDNRLKFLLKK